MTRAAGYRAVVVLILAALVACAAGNSKEGKMPTTGGALAGLTLTIPSGFALKADTTERMGSAIPGAVTLERFRRYQDSAGRGLFAFAWEGAPPRDRGPMAAAEQWKTTVGGEPASVSLTSLFFGRRQQVLVAHFTGPAPARVRFMIYTTLVDKATFAALLASARFDRR